MKTIDRAEIQSGLIELRSLHRAIMRLGDAIVAGDKAGAGGDDFVALMGITASADTLCEKIANQLDG